MLDLVLAAEELLLPPELHAAFSVVLKWEGLLWTDFNFTESLGDVLRLRVADLSGTEGFPASPCIDWKHNAYAFPTLVE